VKRNVVGGRYRNRGCIVEYVRLGGGLQLLSAVKLIDSLSDTDAVMS